MIVAELFTQGPRVSAMSISVLINWASNFVVGYVFPIMQVKMKRKRVPGMEHFLLFFPKGKEGIKALFFHAK